MTFNYIKTTFAVITVLASFACKKDIASEKILASDKTEKKAPEVTAVPYDTLTKTIHIFVALCDNKYQGIVPVPAGIGNGQDPNSNLYWGCGYGIRTYFKKSSEWKFLKTEKPGGTILVTKTNAWLKRSFYIQLDQFENGAN